MDDRRHGTGKLCGTGARLKKRRTRRELFLEKMDKLVPWERLERRIEPFYAKAGRGRRPYPLSVMLRVHCVQLFYNLSDPGMEDRSTRWTSVRRFVAPAVDGGAPMPDRTTILNFRHLLEKHGPRVCSRRSIPRTWRSRGFGCARGRSLTRASSTFAVVDEEPAPRTGPDASDEEAGKQWYFGMKAHIGVDAGSGLAHSLTTTAANASDDAGGSAAASALRRRRGATSWLPEEWRSVPSTGTAVSSGVWPMKPGRRRLLGEGVRRGGREAPAVGAGEG